MYAKYISEHQLDYAPRTITKGQTHYNPYPVEMMLADGYKPVVDTPYPDDGKYYVGHWEERSAEIVMVWVETEPPEEPPMPEDYEEALNRLGVSE